MARFIAFSLCSWSCSAPRTRIGVWTWLPVPCCWLHPLRARTTPRNANRNLMPVSCATLITITNLDPGSCSGRAGDCFVSGVAAGQRDAHAAILVGFGLGEDPDVDRMPRRTERERLLDAFISEAIRIP